MDDQKLLKDLKDQVTSLSKRVSKLENSVFEDRSVIDTPPVEPEKDIFVTEKRPNFEEAVGFKWFSRVGILALVLGVVFFLKYAFDNDLINHLTRIIIGVVAGIGLMVTGELISKNEKYQQWAKKLTGGGFAITYFSVFAAYNFMEYREAIGITLSQDIIALSIVVIGGIALGLKDNSKTFVSVAFLLGFVNAFLGGEMGVLTAVYALFMAVMLVIVSIYKKWHQLGIGGVAATYIIFLSWIFDTNPTFTVSVIFLSAYFAAFTIQSLLTKEEEEISATEAGINTLAFYFCFYMLLDNHGYIDWDGAFTWGMSILSFCLYIAAKYSGRGALRFTYLGLAIAFLTLSIPMELKNQWITIAWAFEAVILGVIGIQLDVKLLRYFSYIVALLATFRAFFNDLGYLEGYARIGALVVPSVLFFGHQIYAGIKKFVAENTEKLFAMPGDFYGTILLAGLLAMELEKFYISVGWAVLALAITIIGFALKQRNLRLPGIALFAFTILKVFLYDSAQLSTLYRMISFLVLGVILLLVSFGYNKYKDKLKDVL